MTPSPTPTPAFGPIPTPNIPLLNPKAMVLDAARRHLFITNHEDNSVIVADENTLTQIARIPMGYHPTGIGLVNDKVYVANNGSNQEPTTVGVISAASLSKVKDIPTESCGAWATHVAVNPKTGLVYVTLYPARGLP